MDLIYRDESYKIIGACLAVYNELGCGFLERVYQEALAIEFSGLGIPYSKEAQLDIKYKNNLLKTKYFADFICYDKIIVELKALESISSKHQSQVLNYLKATGYKLGIIINFGSDKLEHKRIIL